MEKVDYKKKLKTLYYPPSKQVVEVDVPEMNFLMVDGEGAPGSKDFQCAMETLYPVAYTLKFMVKRGVQKLDYSVMPLEGLWWSDDWSSFISGDKDKWKWTLMIMQPEIVTREMVDNAIAQVKTKKNPAALPLLRFEPFCEGPSAQTMHIGPFSEEGPTVERVHTFVEASGYRLAKKHHEIYLSDMRRAAPEKWKTVIRQPMEK